MPHSVDRCLVREIATALPGVSLQSGHFSFNRTVVAGRDPVDPSRSRFTWVAGMTPGWQERDSAKQRASPCMSCQG
jgi:hypothetical protein